MKQERKGVRLLHNARVQSTINGNAVSRQGSGQSRGLLTPLNMVIFFGSGSCPFLSPHVFSSSLAFTISSQPPAGSGRRLDQLPPRGDGTRPLSMCWADAAPMPGTIPLLVCTPSSLGMTHRFPQVSASSYRKTEPGVPGVCSERHMTWASALCGALAEGAQRVDQTSGLKWH